LNADSKFGFEGKELFDILSDIGIELGSGKELCMQCNPNKFLGECIILANFRNLKFRVLQTYPLKRNLALEIQTRSERTWGNLL
jgi:hypothetical protein